MFEQKNIFFHSIRFCKQTFEKNREQIKISVFLNFVIVIESEIMTSKSKTRSGEDITANDLDNIKISDLQLKLTKSGSKSLAWSYFGVLYFKETNQIVESKKYKWMCNICFIEAEQSRLFNE